MIVRITGDERDVANSAWVSTLNEIKAQEKTHDEVLRVVGFLVEHHHTSPFESVTLTFESESKEDGEFLEIYGQNEFVIWEPNEKATMDLLNFVKITYQKNLWKAPLWVSFEKSRPILAKLVSGFGSIQDSSSEDVTSLLGENHGMKVELVHLHDENTDKHSRATWRVRCPLSIAVQILRHRKGSYNMVSGRYRTITQDLTPIVDDFSNIMEKAELASPTLELWSKVDEVIAQYKQIMRELKEAKSNGLITNDEYKRARECVRFVLPEGRMTELYITYYLSDFYSNYKKLRDSVHAQTEHIWIAQEMARSIDRARQED